MEHTKEPWEWSEHKFNAPPFEGTLDHECGIYPPDGEIGPVAIASGKNDARRIVACVNACAGVTTEELEQGWFVAGLVEQRDELHAALKRVAAADLLDHSLAPERSALAIARDVLAKVGAGNTAKGAQ